MNSPSLTALPLAAPLGWVGRQAIAGLSYFGGLAGLLASAARSTFRPADEPFRRSVSAQLAWMLALGAPLVALVHVGLGSFLSMQSYFGGTFVEGTGAVVGVGLLRNMAPLMACLTLAGLVAARVTPELRAARRLSNAPGDDRPGFLERTAAGTRPVAATAPRPSGHRAVAARLFAAALAGPLLSLWGALVGTAVGFKVSQTLLGVSPHTFFQMFWEMIWLRDVVGVFVKGLAFGLFAGLFACHEGLSPSGGDDLGAVSSAACRAACFAGVAILAVNSGWFVLVYHAGPVFGPTLLAPATP